MNPLIGRFGTSLVSVPRFTMVHLQSIITFLRSQYVTLYPFQLAVDQAGLYYDRRRFRRYYQYLDQGYCLFQFKRLHHCEEQSQEPKPDFPLYISKAIFSVLFPRLLFGSMILRVIAVTCFSSVISDTREKRIWSGTEMFISGGKYNEVTFLLWSLAVYGFLRYTLTNCLLDYKFMAVHRVTTARQVPGETQYLTPADLSLTPGAYKAFHRFRRLGILFYNTIMGTLLLGGSLVVLKAILKCNLMTVNPYITPFWGVYAFLWILYVCNGIYSNLTSFMIVSKYLGLKQRSIARIIEKCLLKLRINQYIAYRRLSTTNPTSYLKTKAANITLRSRFLEHNIRYTHLLDELADYNRFWSSFLSFLILIYILLIALILFILLFTGTPTFFKYIYAFILFFHIVLLGAIIANCGALVVRNARLCMHFKNSLAHFLPGLLDTNQLLKLNLLSQCLGDAESGFKLLNNYLINYDTFRVIIYNITMYFILIIKD